MAIKICPYCKCMIILPNGFCRNRDCLLGSKKSATAPQLIKIAELVEELEMDIRDVDIDKLTKDMASELIDKLIKKKVARRLYGSEDE